MESKLINGEERNREHPTRFIIPSKSLRENCKIGDFVKVGWENKDTGERLWVEIISKVGNKYFGALRNTNLFVDIKANDDGLVEFGPEHILNIE